MCKPKLIVTRTLSENAKNVIVNYSNTMAIEAKIIDGKICGTKVYSGEEIYELDDINLWDISELIREVF